MEIKTFVLVFESGMLCHYTDGKSCNPIEAGIQNAVSKYSSANKLVECERAVKIEVCEQFARILVTVTSKFERA